MAEIYSPPNLDNLADIDFDDPLEDHPLNSKRRFWFLPLPGRFGGPTLWDLASGLQGSLTSLDSSHGWSTVMPPGGVGSIFLPSSSSTACVSFASAPQLNNLPVGTLGLWAQSTTLNTWNQSPYLLSKTPDNTDAKDVFRFEYFSGNLYLTLCNGSTSSQVSAAWSPTAGVGYRLVVTWNGTTTFYVNGKSIGSSAQTTYNYANTTALQIGNATNAGANRSFPGWISDVFLARRAWSAAEAALDYRLGPLSYEGVLRRRRNVSYVLPSGTTLNGSGSATLTGSASGSGNLALTGHGSASLTGSASGLASPKLSAGGSAALSGTASALASLSLHGSGSATLTGSAVGAGQVQSAGTLYGSGQATLTGSASASASVKLSGTGSAAARGSAAATPSLALSGSGAASLTGSASASPSQTLSARGAASFSGSATARPSIFLTALGAALLSGSATAYGTIPSTLYGRGTARLTGSASAFGTVHILGSPEYIFVEPARSLAFIEPARNLTFVRQA